MNWILFAFSLRAEEPAARRLRRSSCSGALRAAVVAATVALGSAADPVARPEPHPRPSQPEAGVSVFAVGEVIEAELGIGGWERIDEAGTRAIRAVPGASMTYAVRFPAAGIYFVHLRCHHSGGVKNEKGEVQKGESTNDAVVTIGGAPLYGSDGRTRPVGMRCHSREFRWWSLPKGPGAHTPEPIKNDPVHTFIPQPGVYEVRIGYRSPGLVIDRLAITPTHLAPSDEPRRQVWHDPLTTAAPAAVAATRVNQGGEFSGRGWRMTVTKGWLRVDLPEPAPREGELEVTIAGIDWAAAARAVGPDRKIHFLNMFSNPSGDHHAEAGGTAEDSLWTLRSGTAPDGAPRYGSGFKLLWASRGAKRTAGSDYHEREVRMPEDWRWDPPQAYRFSIRWSELRQQLVVRVANRVLVSVPWAQRGAPLRHVFLGGAADFHALVGPVYSDLRLYDLSGG